MESPPHIIIMKRPIDQANQLIASQIKQISVKNTALDDKQKVIDDLKLRVAQGKDDYDTMYASMLNANQTIMMDLKASQREDDANNRDVVTHNIIAALQTDVADRDRHLVESNRLIAEYRERARADEETIKLLRMAGGDMMDTIDECVRKEAMLRAILE